MANNKKLKGQFYTVNVDYIFQDLPFPNKGKKIIEPFAGNGDLISWLKKKSKLPIEAFDIEPKKTFIRLQDTLKNPPDYDDSLVITNPPYLARNKCKDKIIFDMYNINDLYKAFLLSISGLFNLPEGGIIIIPAGFFFSPRDIDLNCRNNFLSKFKILQVRYFEEAVFPDTKTTVVAFSFEKSDTLLENEIARERFFNKYDIVGFG